VQHMFISFKEAAREIGVCVATVKKWAQHGKIPAIRFGKQRRIPRAAFEAWRRQMIDRALHGVQGDEKRGS